MVAPIEIAQDFLIETMHPDMNAIAPPKTALLIGNTHFYSLFKVIVAGLERKGYDVTVANDEYPNNILGRILGKLGLFSTLSASTYRVLTRDFLEGRQYDIALVFKGRGLSRKLLERMKQSAPIVVGYNFDSFAFNRAPLAWYKYATRYCTFDYADAKRYALPVVDLFSSLPSEVVRPPTRYRLSAIMRNHSRRLRYLDSVLKIVGSEDMIVGNKDVFLYIFELNHITLVLNFIKNPLLYLKYRRQIHLSSLSYADYVDVLTASDFTIDYAHPDQTGITIRCFEALHAGTKLITNNPYVPAHPLFDRDAVIVYRGPTDAGVLHQRFAWLRGRPVARHARTIADFICDLFNIYPAHDQVADK